MKLISLNVSGIQRVDDSGKTVRTGIFKKPVKGPVDVGFLNIAGDDQADRINHGGKHKAVYAFGQQHLAHWRSELPDADVGAGFFGENLSVDELDETTLRVGDRLRIGSCLLEISQPRVPCFKLAMRAGVRTLPRAFIKYGRTGVYFSVVETGSIEAGDAVTVEQRGPEHHTLAELFAAVYDLDENAGTERQQAVLKTALTNAALSEEWYAEVSNRLRRLDGR